MEIRVIKLESLKDGKSLISFKSNYGIAEGFWASGLPQINSSYDVEVELEGDLIWAISACATSELSPKLAKGDGFIEIIAQIETIEDDSCCALRVGDSILMTGIKNIPTLPKGTFIELKPRFIKLFNANL